MKSKTKGDIKATLILLTYIGVGFAGGYWLESITKNSHGEAGLLGFIMSTLTLGLLQCIWGMIRLEIDD